MANVPDTKGHRATNSFSHSWLNNLRNLLSRFQFPRAKRNSCRTDSPTIERKLESTSNSPNSAVLSPYKDIHRGNGGIPWDEKTEENTRGTKAESVEEGEVVPTRTLDANMHLSLRFPVPRRGRIKFHVEAELPVNTYILDSEGINEFYARHGIPSYGGFTNRRNHDQRIQLPFRGDCYLIILNPHPEPVAVHYEVYY